MTTKAVRYTQPLLGEANPAGYLVAVPGASVLIRQDGVALVGAGGVGTVGVFSDNAKTPMINPVPTGVAPGTAGVSTRGELLVYLNPGSGYDAVVTVGDSVTTVPLPDISPDVADVSAPIPPGTYAQGLVATAVKTAPYTAAPKDYVLVDATAGSVAITLPTAPADGTRIGVKLIATSGTNVATFACGGSDHLDLTTGPTSGTITLLNQATILQYAAATAVWTVQSSDLPLTQLDTRFVPAAGNSTVSGVKTLSSAPVLPAGFTFTPQASPGSGSAGSPSLAFSAPMDSGRRTELLVRNFNFLATPDSGVFLGHNVFGSPNYDNTKPGVYLGIEDEYNDGTSHKAEFYWEYLPPSPATFKRLLYGTVNRATHVRDTLTLAADSITIAADDGTNLLAASPTTVAVGKSLQLNAVPVLSIGNSTLAADSTINLDGNSANAASVINFLRAGVACWRFIRPGNDSADLGLWDYANNKYHMLWTRGAGAGGGVTAIGSALTIAGNIGFYGGAAAAKPTVTGSRGGNAALASLLTGLAGLGLLTDSTTA